jgi:hypothetical protein
VFTLRFAMRARTSGAPIEGLYAAAIEMATWVEDRSAVDAAFVTCPRSVVADCLRTAHRE